MDKKTKQDIAETAGAQQPAVSASEETQGIVKSILSRFQIFGKQLQNVEVDVNEAHRTIQDASRNTDQLVKYAANIAQNVQSIAHQMGAYTTTLQETREALENERKPTATPTQEATPSFREDFFGSMRNVEDRGGILGVLGSGLMQGAGRAAGGMAKQAGTAVVNSKAGQATKAGVSSIVNFMKNPKVLLLTLLTAIGTGIYKYFTDDSFKESVNQFFVKTLDIGKEYIIKPLSNMFNALKEGIYNITASIFETLAGVSINLPSWASDLGLPKNLTPFSFLTGAAQSLRTAAEDSKKSRETPQDQPPSSSTPVQAQSTQVALPDDASKVPAEGQTNQPVATPNISGDDAAVMAMIKTHEGVRYKPYKDSKGLWTIGVGHLIGDGKTLPPEMNRTFTEEEVNNMFAQDYVQHKKAAERIPGYSSLGKEGKAGLIDMTFNMGESWFKKWPNFIKSLTNGDVGGVVQNLTNSEWFKQVKGRAQTVVGLIKSGMQKITGGSQEVSPISTPTVAQTPPSSSQTATAAPTTIASPIPRREDSTSLTKQPPTATFVPPTPQTGDMITSSSSAVNEKKTENKQDVAVVDASSSTNTRASTIMSGGGSIPSPVADRGSIDLFNFFNPIGYMKG